MQYVLLFSLQAAYPKKCLKNDLQKGQTASRVKNILRIMHHEDSISNVYRRELILH